MPPVVPTPRTGPRPDEVSRGLPALAPLLPRLMTASLSIQEIERVDTDVVGRRAGVELHGEVGAAQGIDGVIQRLEHGPKYLARRIQLIDAEDDVVSRLAAVVVDVSRDAHVAVPSRVGAPLDVEELGAERGVASGIGRRCRGWTGRQCCLPRQDGCRQCGTRD